MEGKFVAGSVLTSDQVKKSDNHPLKVKEAISSVDKSTTEDRQKNYTSRGAESEKMTIFLVCIPPLCIYTSYISFESLGVVGQCLRGCGALRRCHYHGNSVRKYIYAYFGEELNFTLKIAISILNSNPVMMYWNFKYGK